MSTAVLTRPSSPFVAPCSGTRYVIDSERTTVSVRVRKLGIPVRRRITALAGVIDIPADMTQAQVSVTMQAASLRTRVGPRGTASVFDAAAHPALTFEGRGLQPIVHSMVTADGDRPLWWLTGDLTVLGVARPFRLAVGAVHRGRDGRSLEFNATATLRRSEYGVGRLGAMVSDVVRVSICGRAARA
jgi:polyisoprenoid-binding protein YceI